MNNAKGLKPVLSFTVFTLVMIAVGLMLLEPWSTVTAGYVDKVSSPVCLSTGVGGEVCFPANACLGRCLVDPGTSGNAGDPSGDTGRSFSDMLDSFSVRIYDVRRNLVTHNLEVCFEKPGTLYVYGMSGDGWGSPVEPVFDQAKGKYCLPVAAGDLGLDGVLYFAYFNK